jgi:O-antigen ligase
MIFYYFILLFSAMPNHPWMGDQVGGFTFIKFVGLACMFYAVARIFSRGVVPPFFRTWPARLFVALIVLAFISYAFTGSLAYLTGGPFMIYLSCLLLFFVTLALIDSPQRLRSAVLSLIAALGVASLYTLREFQANGFAAGYRPGYVVGDANFFSGAALLAIPLAYYLVGAKGPRWERIFCLVCMLTTVLALIAGASRGGFYGLCLCVIYIVFNSNRKLPAFGLLLLLIPLLFLMPSSPIKRIVSPNYSDITSTENRRTLWRAGFELVKEHPLTGIGLGRYKGTMEQLGVLGTGGMAHNTYLEYAAELGVFGLLLYLGVLISAYRLLGKIRTKVRDQNDWFYCVSTGMQAGLIGFAGAAFTFSAEYEKPLWIVIFLSACLPALLEARVNADLPTSLAKDAEVTRNDPVQLGRRGAPPQRVASVR